MMTRRRPGSHARDRLCTRNSSSIGVSMGALSSTAATASGCVSSAATCSSSSAMRCPRTLTCSFSRDTLITRPRPVAWRKNVRSPGGPTVSAMKRSGGSNSVTDMPATLRRARTTAHDAARGAGGGAAQVGGGQWLGAGVVEAKDEGPAAGELDHGDGRRVDDDALEPVEGGPEGVGEDRLDDVAVADRHPDRVLAVLTADPGVPVPHRRQGPALHLREGLAGPDVVRGEGHGARRLLHT